MADSDVAGHHTSLDPGLAELRHRILQQKRKCVKDLKREQERLNKITKLESLLSTDAAPYTADPGSDTLLPPKRQKMEAHRKTSTAERPDVTRSRSGQSGGHSRSRPDHSGRSPRSGQQSPSKSKSPFKEKKTSKKQHRSPERSKPKSPAKSHTPKDAPVMQLKEVRYDQEKPEPRKHSSKSHVYMEFENPRSVKKSSSGSSSNQVRAAQRFGKMPRIQSRAESTSSSQDTEVSQLSDRSEETPGMRYPVRNVPPWDDFASSRTRKVQSRKDSVVSTSSSQDTEMSDLSVVSQVETTVTTPTTRSVAVNVPTPIMISPPAVRKRHSRIMVSEGVQTTPTLQRHTLYTPQTCADENVHPDQKQTTPRPTAPGK